MTRCLLDWSKFSGKCLSYPLKLIFDASVEEEVYPKLWKKANIFTAHKKESKGFIKSFRLINF